MLSFETNPSSSRAASSVPPRACTHLRAETSWSVLRRLERMSDSPTDPGALFKISRSSFSSSGAPFQKLSWYSGSA